VGGGEVALRKARLMLQAGAALTVVAPECCNGLLELQRQIPFTYIQAEFSGELLAGMRLAVAATNRPEVNRRVAALAAEQNVWANVVDDLELSSYISPAVIDRSPIVIALSTGGATPVLARLLRARLESLIPAGWGQVARFGAAMRERVRARIGDTDARRAFWESVFQGPIAEDLIAGNLSRAQKQMDLRLSHEDGVARGAVYLVGAGPGNPDLLTFRALRLMQQADVVLYDRLVAPALLDLVRRDAERVYVGKARANHALSQEDINALMVRLAREGKRVLRLKGGDPFIFGRGGEEIESLSAHGIPFEVVPGVTSASGAAAYAGIPLTHRDYAQSVTFVTGHLKDGSIALDWEMLARPAQTVVVYMGVVTAQALCQAFISHGRPGTCPAAVVENATMPSQRVLISTLDDLAREIEQQGIQSPALIIIGDVVKLAGKLAWFHPPAVGETDTISLSETSSDPRV